jgi:hypothetical protein
MKGVYIVGALSRYAMLNVSMGVAVAGRAMLRINIVKFPY